MPGPFELEFFQRGVAEILLLALASGLVGTWIVLRGLSFFAHAVGTATFPGLVLADGLGFSAALGAFGSALVVALLVGGLVRGRDATTDGVTALVLAGALALGVILASDVFQSQAAVDRLLFGSLLAIDRGDQALAAVTAGAAIAGSWVLGPRWLASGFAGRPADRSARWADAVLVLLVALCAVASLSAVGALLATALVVTPAATTRLVVNRLASWQIATVALAASEGVAGLWIAYEFNAPPGAGIAVLSGAVFGLTLLARAALLSSTAGRRRAGAVARAGALTLACLAAVAMVGCGESTGPGDGGGAAGRASDGRLVVVATTPVAADLARRAGGPAVSVRTLVAAGVDPHEYEPRPADIEALAAAGLIVTSGLGLDDWVRELIDASGSSAPVVELGASAVVRRSGDDGGADPHWWHDISNAIAATRSLERTVAAAQPAQAGAVSVAAAAYRRTLGDLDRRIARCVDRVPERDRSLVTNHDALGYFADRYDLRIAGAVIPSQSTAGQASAGEIAALERTIEREGVRAIFPEQAVSSKLADQIARVTGASARYSLFGDTLDSGGAPASTYAGMLTANANSVVRGLTAGRQGCGARA